jgi:hypothetical protein
MLQSLRFFAMTLRHSLKGEGVKTEEKYPLALLCERGQGAKKSHCVPLWLLRSSDQWTVFSGQ